MLLLRVALVSTLCLCSAHAVLVGNDLKRPGGGFDTYGPPPRPAPQYGPPPHIPHREYGVPQQIPFREYGPPALKYGPPKLNFLGGGGGGGGGGGQSIGLHEQIKTHFGVPKPFYGPPHISHKPAHQYGPPPQPASQYGPPKPGYGPPPPLKLQHRPSPNYGPPKPHYGPPAPQPLPSPHPGPLFKPAHQPATSYGPPASGPLNLPPKPVYDVPPSYGPPPLPVSLPGPQPASFNRLPETTIIVSGPGGQQLPHIGGGGGGGIGGPIKQVQIQIDASGHTHSVSGSQAPFHTACDGWKPIPAPVGAYVEQNHIETQDGYSNVAQGPHYNGGSTIITSSHGGGSIIDGLSDEQIVAVALQTGEEQLPHPSGGAQVIDSQLNSIESDALQVSLGSLDDTYSKPPADAFAPGSLQGQKYQTIGAVHGPPPPPPGGNYGPPPPPPGGNYGPPPPPPGGNYGPPPPPPGGNYGPPPPPPGGNYGPPPPQFAAQFGPPPPPPSGNPQPFPQHGAAQPNKPVVYRPPVPTGLIESIGATVQHLDQFGVKPVQQPPTYIPPAANEIAVSGPAVPPPPNAIYGTPSHQAPPPPPPQQQTAIIVEQQLPQPQPGPAFGHQKLLQQYGPPGPPPPPQPQYLPPPQLPHGRPLGPPPPPPAQQYLPGPPPPNNLFLQQQQQHFHSENAYSASQLNQQFVHSQGLPLPQQARFNQHPQLQLQFQQQQQQQQQPLIVHDCGHGPNLVSNSGYQVVQNQQLQQQQHFGSVSAASAGAYNAIAQSIPVAEQHTQFVTGPADSYGPPPSGNDIDIDHTGYASQKSSVAALPDGTDPQNLPGLDGLNVISAQKSQSIQLSAANQQPQQAFQVQFGGSLNNNNQVSAEQAANHEEILSQGLLQSILTAIEQPQPVGQGELPQNHKAQSRSDGSELQTQEQQNSEDDDDEEEQALGASNKIEVRVLPNAHAHEDAEEVPAEVKQIEPIVAAEVDEGKN